MPLIVSPVTVELDIPVTRRTKIHAVVNGDGEQVYHSRSLADVLEYLLDREVVMFDLVHDDVTFQMSVRKPQPKTQTLKGRNHG